MIKNRLCLIQFTVKKCIKRSSEDDCIVMVLHKSSSGNTSATLCMVERCECYAKFQTTHKMP